MTPPDHAQAILLERARRLAAAAAPPPAEAGLELAAFRRCGEYLGLPTPGIREIQPLRAHRWARVPCAPAWVAGLVSLRGRFYTLLDIPAFWGLPAQPPAAAAHLILVRGAAGLEMAVLADEVPVVLTVAVAALEPAPAGARAAEHVRGVTAEALTVLDLNRLLAEPRLTVFDEP